MLLNWGCFQSNEGFDAQELILNETNVDLIRTKIAEASQNHRPLFINSRGGKVSVALKISKEIKKRNLSIIVFEKCLSNCAEIIIPSAKEVTFQNNPLIGFHGNILSYEFYVENYAEKNQHFCNWTYANHQTKLVIEAGLNPNFWKEQMKRLRPEVSFHYENNKCPIRQYNFINHIWFPTSKQLSDLWGLKFRGGVCADNFDRCKTKLDNRYKKGTRLVVGNELYISK